jgi:hypothetical protein
MTMRLGKKDLQQFQKLHKSLLFYANQRLKIHKGVSTVDDLLSAGPKKILKLREALYGQTGLIDDFIKENPHGFNGEELEVISSWKDHVKGSFFLIRYLKKYAVFLDDQSPPKAYGVLALTNTFEEVLGPGLPIHLEAVLLPFKNQIVYDGFLIPYNIVFGRGFRENLNEEYSEAKHRSGIITSLPWKGAEERSDAELLKFYMKNNKTIMRYSEEIEELISKDPTLIRDYNRHLGQIHARKIRKKLRGLGVNDAWFAVIDGITIAGGESKEQVTDTLKVLLPEGKRDLPYIFHYKKKTKT